MNKRSGNVDFVRFIAALLIMGHHIYNTGVKVEEYAFYDGRIYIELFLFITGFYTAKHYSSIAAENRPKDAFQYSIKKFIPMLPYASIVTLFGWVTKGILGIINMGWTWKHFLVNFMGNFSLDLLLISDAISQPLIVPLWYLSAMIIVFPLFALFVQIKNRYTKIIISLFCSLMYYGWIGLTRGFPDDMLRVFVGMMLGVVIYEFSVIFKEQITAKPKWLLTVIEVLVFAYPIFCSYHNWCYKGLTSEFICELCFFINMLLCLPGFTYSTMIRGKFFNYLGKLSMPLFILHWYVGTLVCIDGDKYGWDKGLRITIYYAVSLIITALLMFIIERCKGWKKIVKKEINLID